MKKFEKEFREEIEKNVKVMVDIVGLKGNEKDLHFMGYLLGSYRKQIPEMNMPFGLGAAELKESMTKALKEYKNTNVLNQ